jgi:hypothetical protein
VTKEVVDVRFRYAASSMHVILVIHQNCPECTGKRNHCTKSGFSAPVNGDTVKTSTGAVFNIQFAEVEQ